MTSMTPSKSHDFDVTLPTEVYDQVSTLLVLYEGTYARRQA